MAIPCVITKSSPAGTQRIQQNHSGLRLLPNLSATDARRIRWDYLTLLCWEEQYVSVKMLINFKPELFLREVMAAHHLDLGVLPLGFSNPLPMNLTRPDQAGR